MTAKPTHRQNTAIGVMITVLLLICSVPSYAGQNGNATQGNINPAVESVSDGVAFIAWAAPNPGGTILHYAVVQYGKDPKHLDLTATSPTRINPGHAEMVFRARVGKLEPGTTYYFRAYSSQANGIYDSQPSAVGVFTTQPTDSR
jgi:hypothetical protein